jgi:hypothetical protein
MPLFSSVIRCRAFFFLWGSVSLLHCFRLLWRCFDIEKTENVQSIAQIGMKKLSLLAPLSEAHMCGRFAGSFWQTFAHF